MDALGNFMESENSNKKCNCEGVEQLPKNKLYFIGVD